MTPTTLAVICQGLYGARWQSAFARDIARERETVNRWARGRYPIPKAVEDWLIDRLSGAALEFRRPEPRANTDIEGGN